MSNLKIWRSLNAGRTALAWATTLLVGISSATAIADEQCVSTDENQYLCDIPNAEDLVRLPGTDLLIASNLSPGSSYLNIIDTNAKTWRAGYPPTGRVGAAEHDADKFPDCPGPPPTELLGSHGLFIAEGDNGSSTLYVVSHGARESIEVFDITLPTDDVEPTITWIGCVLTPEAQEANSVAVFDDGSLLATIPIEHGFEFAQAMTGVSTGAVYHWDIATKLWARLPETAQPYANGIAISADEQRFYVASSGLQRVIAYSTETPANKLGESEVMSIAPDNLHADDSGQLLTAGLILDYPACDALDDDGKFSLALYGSCPRPFQLLAYDPETLEASLVVEGDANPDFSNATMGIVLNGTAWIGSFAADRIEYIKLGSS